MRLKNDKVNFIAHLVSDALWDDEDVEFLMDRNEVRLYIKKLITRELMLEDEIDDLIRERLRNVPNLNEGDDEWEIRYTQEFEREMKRRRNIPSR